MPYTWLLFDADGTLFDFDRAEFLALRHTFEETGHGFQARYAETYERINTQLWNDLEAGKITPGLLATRRFDLLFEELGLQQNGTDFSGRYIKNLGNCPDLLDGAEQVLDELQGRARMMLITNGLKDVQRSRVAKSTIKHHFVDIVISEEIGHAKPDRRIFDEAFRRMDHPAKEEVLIIGDSLSSDIRGGNLYGIDTCWVNPAGRACPPDLRCTYEITHLHELPALLKPVLRLSVQPTL